MIHLLTLSSVCPPSLVLSPFIFILTLKNIHMTLVNIHEENTTFYAYTSTCLDDQSFADHLFSDQKSQVDRRKIPCIIQQLHTNLVRLHHYRVGITFSQDMMNNPTLNKALSLTDLLGLKFSSGNRI